MALRLASEAQSLQVSENLGMAPLARLVVVDVESSSEPGVYKVPLHDFWIFGLGTPVAVAALFLDSLPCFWVEPDGNKCHKHP